MLLIIDIKFMRIRDYSSLEERSSAMGGFSIWHWIIVLAVIVLVFGTKRLRTLGADVGGALKSFKEASRDADVKITDKP